jgi:hypothetical protein
MVFLPGTSFAVNLHYLFHKREQHTDAPLLQALLSMPFVTSSKYMSNTARIWLWVLLTVTTMLFCFGLYWRVTRKRFKRDQTVLDRIDKDIAMKPLTQGVNGTV